MSSLRLVHRAATRAAFSLPLSRPFTSSPALCAESVPLNSRCQDTAEQYRKFMMQKPLNPHLTNTSSTIANDFPSLGSDKPPPELLTSVDGEFAPKDSVPANTERMTGGTQDGEGKAKAAAGGGPNAELDVGEIEGGTFKVEPMRREGEEVKTIRARLTYQSRKRGTLESDLLLSTFADQHLGHMTPSQLQAYDLFLDENDWDIYYWATQEPTPTSLETAEGAAPGLATPAAQGKESPAVRPGAGEWAQTVGTFKPAYRPVPARWKNSEILSMLRKHVIEHSAGGVHEGDSPIVGGEGLTQRVKGTGGSGLGMMPALRNFDA